MWQFSNGENFIFGGTDSQEKFNKIKASMAAAAYLKFNGDYFSGRYENK